MTYAQRFALALAVTLALSLTTARAQTPSVSTVNVTPDERRVRVSALGDASDLRVAVSDESGDIVFEGGPVTGGHLDWALSDAQGLRVPPGSYTLTVTYRTTAGKLKRRVEQVLVTEEVTTETSAAQEEPTPQAVATITGQGTTGRISKFTGTNSIVPGIASAATSTTTNVNTGVAVVGAQTFVGLPVVGFMVRTFNNGNISSSQPRGLLALTEKFWVRCA